MIKIRHKALSLMEIIVGSLIMIIAFISLMASFIGARQLIARSNRRSVASKLSSGWHSLQYQEIDENNWDNPIGPLWAGPVPVGGTEGPWSNQGDVTPEDLGTAATGIFTYGPNDPTDPAGARPSAIRVRRVADPVTFIERDYREVEVEVDYETP